MMVSKGKYPQMALIQVTELFSFAQIYQRNGLILKSFRASLRTDYYHKTRVSCCIVEGDTARLFGAQVT